MASNQTGNKKTNSLDDAIDKALMRGGDRKGEKPKKGAGKTDARNRTAAKQAPQAKRTAKAPERKETETRSKAEQKQKSVKLRLSTGQKAETSVGKIASKQTKAADHRTRAAAK